MIFPNTFQLKKLGNVIPRVPPGGLDRLVVLFGSLMGQIVERFQVQNLRVPDGFFFNTLEQTLQNADPHAHLFHAKCRNQTG